MKKLALLIAPIILFSCATSDSPFGKKSSPQYTINSTCVEVLLKKVDQDSLVYEKELPWDLLPFDLRTDEYHSIGTAFAISEDKLVTAAHVLFLHDNSTLYKNFYIRHQDGFVQKIDLLHSFDNEKDYAIFSVKDREFDTYLDISKSYNLNDEIYAVGNIYGQGIVAIPGTIAGSMKERSNGKWEYIKTAPNNDKGSSGGPLLDSNYDVLSVIVSKDDNFSYSLPLSEIELSANTGRYREKMNYTIDLAYGLSSDFREFKLNVSLPKSLSEVKTEIGESYKKFYYDQMDQFFAENQEKFFPATDVSEEALFTAVVDDQLQVYYREQDDQKWYASKLETKKSNLQNNGYIVYSDVESTRYINLVKPDNISHEELYSNPQLIMDTLLQGSNIPRQLAGQEIRILSMGKPYRESSYEDSYGRMWYINSWHIEYSDEVGIFIYSPTPDGLVGLLKFTSYSQEELWLYDLKKIVNWVYIPYYGELRQWKEFLEQKDFLYGFLKTVELDYTPSDQLSIKTDIFNLTIDNETYNITDKMVLGLFHDIYQREDEPVWGFRKLLISEEKSENYFVSYMAFPPTGSIVDKYQNRWETYSQGKHPYNNVPHSEDGRINVGTIHPQFVNNPERLYTLYVGYEASTNEDIVKSKLESLKKNFVFK